MGKASVQDDSQTDKDTADLASGSAVLLILFAVSPFSMTNQPCKPLRNALFYICKMPTVMPDKFTAPDMGIMLRLFMLPAGHLTNSSHLPVVRLFFLLPETEIHHALLRCTLAFRIFLPARIP